MYSQKKYTEEKNVQDLVWHLFAKQIEKCS